MGRAARSALMRRIRPSGTSLERWARAVVLGAWDGAYTLNDASLPGSPDIAIPDLRLAVFADGCFWHLCHACLKSGRVRVPPHAHWVRKLDGNRRRDARVRRRLRRAGWRTMTLREHGMGDPMAVWRAVRRIGRLSGRKG